MLTTSLIPELSVIKADKDLNKKVNDDNTQNKLVYFNIDKLAEKESN
jgi:hypothetical protein